MIVHISAEAARNLEEIGDHIARDNPVRAVSFLRERQTRLFERMDQGPTRSAL